MFCPKCGSILVPKKEGNKRLLACSCGYKDSKSGMTLQENVPKPKDGKEVEVVTDGEIETLPKTKQVCPKCGHQEAYYWTVQTRSADEAATRFFRCVKCSHTWREYD